jgi:hypothetical protein
MGKLGGLALLSAVWYTSDSGIAVGESYSEEAVGAACLESEAFHERC